MDIKPGNIFITRNKRLHNSNDSSDDDYEEDDPSWTEEEIIYKIGKCSLRKVCINPWSSWLEEVESGRRITFL
jgi:hypothetical protein